jgi:hypothetical protein
VYSVALTNKVLVKCIWKNIASEVPINMTTVRPEYSGHINHIHNRGRVYNGVLLSANTFETTRYLQRFVVTEAVKTDDKNILTYSLASLILHVFSSMISF